MKGLQVDYELIEDIASRLDLRQPNRDALEAIAVAVSIHFDVEGRPPPFEGVVDVATGVGKTFVMAGSMEYFAARGHRHFVVISPGAAILRKTVGNFTDGGKKSLVGAMEVRPEMVKSESFDSPLTVALMDDEEAVKIYVFTVQSLIRPTTKQGRRTHEFREGIGAAFYRRLQDQDDLIVFADEHHAYFGPAFSRAVRGLKPYALVGLTATPHPRTRKDEVVFRYPLAAAIADRFVKTPVLVGRRDERVDERTKLADGVRLLEMKRQAVERYVAATGAEPMNPVMLVVAQTIDDAERYREIMEDPEFMEGRLRGRVLTVHSERGEAALQDLEGIERANSPLRVVISVGMLKEGWDVKNVYVIASMRASVSEILTEQTLGRGLRLPFGRYTGVEMLATLEVLAHESYAELLRRAKVLKEELVDSRTLLARSADGDVEAREQEVGPEVRVSDDGTSLAEDEGTVGGFTLTSLEERTSAVAAQVSGLSRSVEANPEMPDLTVPVIGMNEIRAEMSLADVEPARFEELGKRHAADPETLLLRTMISARRSEDGHDVELVRRAARDQVEGNVDAVPLEESQSRLIRMILQADEVPARPSEAAYVEALVDAYLKGLGDKAEATLAAHPERAASAFREVLRQEQQRFEAKPEFGEVIEHRTLARERLGRAETSGDLAGDFRRGVGYEGWAKGYFPQAWFDSTPEFRLAGIMDGSKDVAYWVKLVRGELPILYTSAGNLYNPDFLVAGSNGVKYLVEVKADREVDRETVKKKREAARRWARRASGEAGEEWEYLLVTESDITACKGS